jgi:hypothetical protein
MASARPDSRKNDEVHYWAGDLEYNQQRANDIATGNCTWSIDSDDEAHFYGNH